MGQDKRYRVKEVASLTGVTVRTLHHYDAIGLLSPARRSEAGYRLYVPADLLRLQHILVYRELGLKLETIKKILSDPEFDPIDALHQQREALRERAADTDRMLRSIDAALAALQGDSSMSVRDMFEGFDPCAYDDEVEQRWGNTEAFAQSQKRMKSYGPQQYKQIKAESTAILDGLAERLSAGAPASDPAVLDLAERHRLHIDRWFYSCSHRMHLGLAQMYVADARFKASMDAHGEGVTEFLAAAIEANADAAASDDPGKTSA